SQKTEEIQKQALAHERREINLMSQGWDEATAHRWTSFEEAAAHPDALSAAHADALAHMSPDKLSELITEYEDEDARRDIQDSIESIGFEKHLKTPDFTKTQEYEKVLYRAANNQRTAAQILERIAPEAHGD